MARGIQKWTETVIARREKDGRGHGTGKDYIPWIQVDDFPSAGYTNRVFSKLTSRVHHLLSRQEWYTFLMLEWQKDVIDIREQYPLDRTLTQEIAAAKQIAHPFYPGTHIPYVMTVDFLVTRLRNGKQILEAYNVKSSMDLENERTIDKLEIQRAYFEGMQIPHTLIVDSEIPRRKVKNIEVIRGTLINDHEVEPYPGCFAEHMPRIADQIRQTNSNQTLADFCRGYDHVRGLPAGTALRLAKNLIFNKQLAIDLSSEDLDAMPIVAITVQNEAKLVARGEG